MAGAFSSARYEDLKDDLLQLEERIRNKIGQGGITAGTLNQLFQEGDNLLNQMKREIDAAPVSVRSEMHSNWVSCSGNWSQFKVVARNKSSAAAFRQAADFGSTSSTGGGDNRSTVIQMSRGIDTLERTSASLMRAEQAARESEQIGTEVIGELGVQREQLIRTRTRLEDTNQDLNRSRLIIRAINRRVITNKFLLFVIIFIEVIIIALLVYFKFLKNLFK